MDPNQPPQPTSSLSYDEGFFTKDNILKFVIGLIAIVAVIALAVFVVFPLFFSSKNEKVTLLYWGVWEDQATFSTLIADFKRQHPNIDIDYKKQDIKTLGNYIDRIATRSQSGTGPDIFRYHNSWVYRIKPLLLPLPSDVVSAAQLDSVSYNVVKSDLKVNGAYYGVPLGIDSLALFINQDIFKAAGITEYPKTWDDFVRIARQLTVKDQNGKITTSGAAIGTYDTIAHASDILSLLFVQNGAELKDLSGKRRKNAEDALEFYTCFAKDQAPDCVKVWDDSGDNSKLAFTKGNVAMYFGYSWDILDIKNANPNLSFSIVPVPHLAGSSSFRNNTIASYWVEGVSSASKHPKEAFEFLKFISSRENIEKLYTIESKQRLFGELYPRSDMKSLLSQNQLLNPFVSQLDNATSTIFSSDTYDNGITLVLNGHLGNSIRGVLSGRSVPSSIDALAAGVSQTIGKYGK